LATPLDQRKLSHIGAMWHQADEPGRGRRPTLQVARSQNPRA
jgi:hypothetical protein